MSSNGNSIVTRARSSQWTAIPMAEAESIVAGIAEKFEKRLEDVPLREIRPGMIIGEQLRAPHNVPMYRTSIKDGYAMIAQDGSSKRKVVGSSTAGHVFTGELSANDCVRISTGAVVPDGADCVVQVEDTSLEKFDEENELEINVHKAPKNGQDIRQVGSDVSEGEILMDVGCRLGPPEIGLIHSFGIHSIRVFKKPTVTVFSTGNELCESNKIDLKEGAIRDSNRPQLLSLFNSNDFKTFDGGIVRDEPKSIETAIRNASRYSSVIVTSGGVSMGEKDYLKHVITDKLGLKIDFGRVWMKPGLPCTVAHGSINGKQIAIFALPGNPVSSFVCAHLFALPFLRTIGGWIQTCHSKIKVKLANGIRLGPRPEYCRAWLEYVENEQLPLAHVTGNQMSSRLASLVGAQVLLQLPQACDEKPSMVDNDIVEALLL